MDEFPDYIIEEMEERGMTVQELAQASGIVRETVDALLEGTFPLNLEIAEGFAKVFNVPAQFFLNLDRTT